MRIRNSAPRPPLRSPSYLVHAPFGYCFRVVVPPDLHPIIKNREIRYSLRTGHLSEARHRAGKMGSFVQTMFRGIRNGNWMRDLSPADIKGLLERQLQETIADHSNLATGAVTRDSVGCAFDDSPKTPSLCDYRHARETVDELLHEEGIELDRQSESYKQLCKEYLRMMLKGMNLHQPIENDNGGSSEETDPQPEIVPPAAAEGNSVHLQRIIELYVAEQEMGNRWTEKSKFEIEQNLKLGLDLIGNLPVKMIDHLKARQLKEQLIRLPSNMNKIAPYRDMTLEEILQTDVPADKRLSTSSVNKILDRISSLLNWAVKNGYMDRNPVQGMQIASTKREDEERSSFSNEDLHKLFHSKEYLGDAQQTSHAFWMPVLGLFTGARLDELAQLHLEDIRQEDGVWVFDINDKPGRKLKNKQSRRLIPLHPFLVEDLKLPKYADQLKAQGETRLFPELKQRRDGYGATVNQWFNGNGTKRAGYRERCGITEEGKSFHSFRHTFINSLKQNYEVDSSMIAELAGHGVQSITLGRYGKRYSPRGLLEQAIVRLNYGVDLSHLKKSRLVASL